jgi:hypothetical protein
MPFPTSQRKSLPGNAPKSFPIKKINPEIHCKFDFRNYYYRSHAQTGHYVASGEKCMGIIGLHSKCMGGVRKPPFRFSPPKNPNFFLKSEQVEVGSLARFSETRIILALFYQKFEN